MNDPKYNALKGREDISRFVVHLTRDDTDDFKNGGTAEENFQDILNEQKIIAYQPHCIYTDKIPKKLHDHYSVTCFTEVPLTQLHLLTQRIPGRKVLLEPYGFVFSKEYIIRKGAQPAIYINSYNNNYWLREAANELYNIAESKGFNNCKISRFLPFLNAMHERYDFTWEREWRVCGDVDFLPEDIIAIILPENHCEDFREMFAIRGIPVITPGLYYEEIIGEFSKQQQKTREIWVNRKRKIQKLLKQKK